jgi:ParB-like chromosome segregation protein Spo0J
MDGGTQRDERQVAVDGLGELLGSLRLRRPEAVRSMQQSLLRHGQLTSVTVFRGATGQLELVDGFKRLQACRALGWATLRIHELGLEGTQAKAAVETLNRQGGLTELEEGWLVRSLYREDRLSQPEIGQLLSRHKSWVCRRLMLVELLDEAVQADVRLGLVAPRTAVLIARLPRGNQAEVSTLVASRGLTTLQTDRLVAALLAAADDAELRRILDEWATGRAGPGGSGPSRHSRPKDSPAMRLVLDAGLLQRVAARLEARLLERPLSALGAEGASAVRCSLKGLGPVLELLQQAVSACIGQKEEPR